jgi:uncharacterized protein (AIM24 family)
VARFAVHQLEGMNYVQAVLDNETIRAEPGAFCYMTGDITIHSKLIPSIGGAIKSLLASEAVYRPTYTGTGEITLESSFGGFHVLELHNEAWILERGAYWASEGSVNVSYHRESLLTALWSGEGLVYLQTKVSGSGKVLVTTRGPIETIEVTPGKKIVAEDGFVIARTPGVSMKIRRPTKTYLGRFTAGEPFVRVFAGEGRVLLNPSPYWRYRMFNERNGASVHPTQIE